MEKEGLSGGLGALSPLLRALYCPQIQRFSLTMTKLNCGTYSRNYDHVMRKLASSAMLE